MLTFGKLRVNSQVKRGYLQPCNYRSYAVSLTFDDEQSEVSACSSPWSDLLGWMEFGLCREKQYIEYYREESVARSKWAKQICKGCPVRSQCLQWGLENAESCGIWGGLTARERRAVAAIAHDGTWRTQVARKPWCPWCESKDIYSPEPRRLQCNGCSFEWPGLLPALEKGVPAS